MQQLKTRFHNRPLQRILLRSILLFLASFSTAHAFDVYVAPNGNDRNDGSIDRPLRTLDAARKVAREEKHAGAVNVYFRAGTYPVTKRVTFTADDSGRPGAPIKYSSYPGETAFFDGLIQLDTSKFTKVGRNANAKLHPSARGKAWSAAITDRNLIALLKKVGTGLSHNNRMLLATASPNKGFYHVAKIYSKGTGKGTYQNPKGGVFDIHESLDYPQFRREIDRGGRQAYIEGYLTAAWFNETSPIQRFGGTGSKVFVLKDKLRYDFKLAEIPRFRIKNMLATMDSQREWFFDHTDNRLYFIPPNGSISPNDSIGIWGGPEVILVKGANHISFERFVFQHLGKGVNGDAAISVREGNNIRIAGSTFRYISAPLTAVNFFGPGRGFPKGATNCSLSSSDLYDNVLGSRLFGGSYNKNSITPGRNRFENNHFTQVDSRDHYGNAAGVNGAGQIFRNNVVHNSNGQPITHSGVDHLFDYNEIFNVGVEEGDGGAVYTGANLFSFGNKLQYNFVHHLITTPGIIERGGFFSDDYDGGDTYSFNTMYKAAQQSIKMNAGSGHTVTNNVIMNARNGVDLLGRPATYNRNFDVAVNLLRTNPNSNSKSNYIGRAEKVIGDFANNNTATYNKSWDNSFWAKRYPFLRNMLGHPEAKLGMGAREVRVYNNLFFGVEKTFQHSPNHGGERGSLTLDQSHFVNPSTLNFRFKTPRPNGYPDTRFERIGLKKDAYRRQVPRKDRYRGAIRNRWKNTPGYLKQRYNRNTINGRIYYNTGPLLIAESQRGLGVKEGDARKNSGNNPSGGNGNNGGNNTNNQSAFAANSIPGKVEAENYDKGGPNIAFNDNTKGNSGNKFRQDDVDIAVANDNGGGHTIGWIANGEWLEFTINNIKAGRYDIRLRVAAAGFSGGKSIALSLDGKSLGRANFNGSGGWQKWKTETISNINIAGGRNKVLRLNFGGGAFNVNWVEFVAKGNNASNPPPPPPPRSTPAPVIDQCNTTSQCRAKFGSSATDCKNSRSNNSICMCGNAPCN